jgi:hypothetical protein
MVFCLLDLCSNKQITIFSALFYIRLSWNFNIHNTFTNLLALRTLKEIWQCLPCLETVFAANLVTWLSVLSSPQQWCWCRFWLFPPQRAKDLWVNVHSSIFSKNYCNWKKNWLRHQTRMIQFLFYSQSQFVAFMSPVTTEWISISSGSTTTPFDIKTFYS